MPAADKTVIEHLQDGAVQGDGRIVRAGSAGGRGDAEHDKAHVVHGRVGHQPLEVRLAVGGQRAKDDRRGRQEGQRTGKVSSLQPG